MNRSVMSLGTLFTMGTFGAGALLLVACAGKVIGGGPAQQLSAVSVSEINKPVVACGGGFAHPNVCCEASPGKAASCGVFVGAPFQTCDSSYTTYPDPRSCCPLDGSGDCIAPPPSPPPISPPICAYACPAGQYELAASPGTCCFNEGSTTVCSSPVTLACDSGCTCACPAGGPCPPCDCPPEPSCPIPSTTTCDACPPGWQVPAGEPLLCCNDTGGAIECFSQAVPPTPSPLPIVGTGGAPGRKTGGTSTH